MAGLSKMRSMELSEEEKQESVAPINMDKPKFPPGLKLCLTEAEFEKLDLARVPFGEVSFRGDL